MATFEADFSIQDILNGSIQRMLDGENTHLHLQQTDVAAFLEAVFLDWRVQFRGGESATSLKHTQEEVSMLPSLAGSISEVSLLYTYRKTSTTTRHQTRSTSGGSSAMHL